MLTLLLGTGAYFTIGIGNIAGVAIVIDALGKLEIIWLLVDVLNGLMAISY